MTDMQQESISSGRSRDRAGLRYLAVLVALCWSCGVEHLSEVDSEPLSAPDRHQLSDDVARALTGLQVMVPFLGTTRDAVIAGPVGNVALFSAGVAVRNAPEAISVRRVLAQPIPSCVAAEWVSANGLEQRLLARACRVPSGELVDGLIFVDVGDGEFAGVRSYSFTELHMGDMVLDGSITTSQPNGDQLDLTGDVRFVHGTQSVRALVRSGVAGTKLVWADLDGIFSSSSGTRFSLSARGVHTVGKECSPSMGTVQLTRETETFTFEFVSAARMELRTTLGLAEMWPLPACP
jgi:hypothetical protein